MPQKESLVPGPGQDIPLSRFLEIAAPNPTARSLDRRDSECRG
jgi:hypothetical protein